MQFVRSIILSGVIGVTILSTAVQQAHAQAVTTAFTYQGVLKNGGAPVNGTVDLRFTLWDAAAAGAQVGASVPVNGITLTDGLVVTSLNFGVSAFGGNQRWLQIEIDSTPAGGVGPFVTLTPRQPLTAVPYAMFSLSGSGQWTPNGSAVNYTAGNVSVGTTNQNARMTIYPATGGGTQTGLYVRNTDGASQYVVANFVADSAAANAIVASVGAGNGASGRAVSATSAATNGAGLYGANTSTAGNAYGVYGISDSTTGRGVYGVASANTGTTYGVFGQTNSATGYGGYFMGRGYFSQELGVGTSNPAAFLHVNRPAGETIDAFRVATNSGSPLFVTTSMSFTGNTVNTYTNLADTSLYLNNSSAGNVYLAAGGGDVGVGTTAPSAKLHVIGGTDSEPGSGGFIVAGPVTSTNVSIDNNEIMARNNGAPAVLSLNNDGGDVSISAAGTGKLICKVLQITGGADLSEQFQVNSAEINPEPGMVVVIDPNNPGELIPATSAYDKKVAGVISGANGVATGMMMGHNGTIADGDHAVALTGRVYCLVDATDAAIEPGDLLTTSATAGHAMKAEDAQRSHGAVIGKAMTALPRGEQGLVLVLVNLQ